MSKIGCWRPVLQNFLRSTSGPGESCQGSQAFGSKDRLQFSAIHGQRKFILPIYIKLPIDYHNILIMKPDRLVTSVLELKVEGSNPGHPETFIFIFSFRNAETRTNSRLKSCPAASIEPWSPRTKFYEADALPLY